MTDGRNIASWGRAGKPSGLTAASWGRLKAVPVIILVGKVLELVSQVSSALYFKSQVNR